MAILNIADKDDGLEISVSIADCTHLEDHHNMVLHHLIQGLKMVDQCLDTSPIWQQGGLEVQNKPS